MVGVHIVNQIREGAMFLMVKEDIIEKMRYLKELSNIYIRMRLHLVS